MNVKYRSGKDMAVADTLSRAYIPDIVANQILSNQILFI